MITSAFDRFLSKISKTESGCWLWTASKVTSGYGKFRYNGKQVMAHRASYMMHNNCEIPKDIMVCHKCDVPACVNPDHLFLGTNRDNRLDSINKGRVSRFGPIPGTVGGVKGVTYRHPSIYSYRKGCRCPECILEMQTLNRKYR